MEIEIFYTNLIPTPNFEKKGSREIGFSVDSDKNQYQKVWTGTTKDLNIKIQDDWKTLEAIFNYMNLREPIDFIKPYRSLSIGDVVSLDGRYFVCQTLDWRILELDEVNCVDSKI